jgi:hypothetical protein
MRAAQPRAIHGAVSAPAAGAEWTQSENSAMMTKKVPRNPSPVLHAVLKMKKLDIATLQRAHAA